MTKQSSLDAIERRIVRAHDMTRLRQIRESLSDEYAASPAVKTMLLTREKELLKR